MNSRLTVFAVLAVALASFAVPALAAPSEEMGSVQSISVRALAKARLALLTARSAKSESRRAARTAEAALNAAGKAVGPTGATGAVGATGAAGATGATGAAGVSSPAVESDFAPGSVTTDSETFEQLADGPAVTVTVPASGLIEVWGQATMEEGGAVSLFEDGVHMPGQNNSELCTPAVAGGILFAGFGFGPPEPTVTVGTPSSAFCGTSGAPGAVMFETTPGLHTYELRYSIGCGCEPEITFSDRLLRVAPRL